MPDERGVTHIDALTDAIGGRRPDRLTYFAFDLLYLGEDDLRRRPIEERKQLLLNVLDEAGSKRIVFVDHIVGRGAELFERVREAGAEGIVSKRRGSIYHGRESRDWLKTKCHQVGRSVITGFEELGPGRVEAVYVAEELSGALVPVGQVRFGFAGRRSQRWRSVRACGRRFSMSLSDTKRWPTAPSTAANSSIAVSCDRRARVQC